MFLLPLLATAEAGCRFWLSVYIMMFIVMFVTLFVATLRWNGCS